MGNCHFKTESHEKSSIGRGGFGKVWKIEKKSNKTFYALKEISKSRVITKKSVHSVMNERHCLSVLKHPFLVNMVYAFQDRENLYLVMDLMTGGDLRTHLSKQKKFTEEQTKFFIACIICGLEYIHSQAILHRDIKPENLVFDSQGYLRITDFGIARGWRPDNAADTSGTPGYMAPEVMCRQNHDVDVDYYALGIITYECMMGKVTEIQRPYGGKNRKEIRDQILAKQIQLKKADLPEGWSIEAADFINGLIQRKPSNRLGQNGISELKNHFWFKDYPWEKLYNKELEPPYVPDVVWSIGRLYLIVLQGKIELKQSTSTINWENENSELLKQNAVLLRRNSVQRLFDGYNFDINTTTVVTANNTANTQIAFTTSNTLTHNNNNNILRHSPTGNLSVMSSNPTQTLRVLPSPVSITSPRTTARS